MTLSINAEAVRVDGRVLPQHQAALMALANLASDPDVLEVKWLDLACGRGQILSCIDGVIDPRVREKIEYVAVDLIFDNTRETERRARASFKSARAMTCRIQDFERHLDEGEVFDFVTMTNTVHEIRASDLASTFVAALTRISDRGMLYFYDMESLPEYELGAIPWRASEVEVIITAILKALGENRYKPFVSQVPHRSCNGWCLQINRQHLSADPEKMRKQKPAMIEAASAVIDNLLCQKCAMIHSALQMATEFGVDGGTENREVEAMLYDFWAIMRALGIEPGLAGSTKT